ncbi:hypothetical protein GCM10025868_38860 [Angustibacter aerolatus]|uniref:Histidine phosphatase family protein n=1 Tax=Angustibacter aerolatus TaxID=1162965 RepID=A0ABQ6JM54_9ACTN|nr:histidine phosphatase family protein [Angustibacter aerolatus]GMA88636.1 hypothetical protein GCM10025868_38860 [Angustibacter aerolatus]
MAATTVLVVRHGQSEGNVSNRLSSAAPGTPLTDLGREQAARTGAALADRGVTAVWASPLLRAQQTARLVADAVGVADVATLDGVREFGLGTLEGAESDEAWAEPGRRLRALARRAGSRSARAVRSRRPRWCGGCPPRSSTSW